MSGEHEHGRVRERQPAASAEAPEQRRAVALVRLVRSRRRRWWCRPRAVLVSLLLFGVFIALTGAIPLDVYPRDVPRRVRHLVLVPEHAAARRAADADRALHRAAGAARPGRDRRRGRAGASGGLAAAALGPRSVAGHRSSITLGMALAGMLAGGLWIGARGRAARVARRQRDDQQLAAHLHRASRC